MRLDVQSCGTQAFGVILEEAECSIAQRAQKAADRACLMAVVNVKRTRNAAHCSAVFRSSADGAQTALRLMQRIVFERMHAKAPLSSRVCARLVEVTAVFLSVDGCLVTRALLAVPLKSIGLVAMSKELGARLHRLAPAAPFLIRGNRWATNKKSVMPAKVLQRLSLNPSEIRAIARCNRRPLPASALAEPIFYFACSNRHPFLNHRRRVAAVPGV